MKLNISTISMMHMIALIAIGITAMALPQDSHAHSENSAEKTLKWTCEPKSEGRKYPAFNKTWYLSVHSDGSSQITGNGSTDKTSYEENGMNQIFRSKSSEGEFWLIGNAQGRYYARGWQIFSMPHTAQTPYTAQFKCKID